jgi:hypothetical protein
MFLITAPRTDAVLWAHRNGLKNGAISIFATLTTLGIFEIIMALFLAPLFQNSGNFAILLDQMRHGFQYNDGTALGQQATENLLEGENPYAHSNLVEAMLKYNGSFDRVTPLRAGRLSDVFPYPTQHQIKQVWDTSIQDTSQIPPELESHMCYPAGFFLLPAPFIAAGITDIRIVYVIFVLAGVGFALWRIPKKNWLIFTAFAVISLELWNSLADGETGSIVFPFLLAAWITMGKNRWISAVAMAVAVATKQTAWFFLPFYLILLWRKVGLKPVVFSTVIIGGVFIATNAYFFAQDPGLWFQSILSPMTDPMFPLGVGLISFVRSGMVNIQISLPFTIIEAIVFFAVLFWYARNCSRYPYAGPLISLLPLFFAWRSLWSYFFYVPIITLAWMLVERENDWIALPQDNTGVTADNPVLTP